MVKEKGVSVIICSRNHKLCEQLIKSMENTIGTDFETIIFDNVEKQWCICKVYNHCAKKAKYRYLCFIHEDVITATRDWGKTMIEFTERTANCGVIGFAGGRIAKKNFLDWEYGPKSRYRFYHPEIKKNDKNYNISKLTYKYNNPDNEDFAKAVTLDGLFLFTSYETWKENPFDEKMFKGFHFYDADFTFAIAQTKQNYVCLLADIYHFSGGNRNNEYYEDARVFQKKWKNKLPYAVEGEKITFNEELNGATYYLYNILKECIRHIIEINGNKIIILLLLNIIVKTVKILLRIITGPINSRRNCQKHK